MEHAANKNVKMGVDQVKTILDIHSSVLMKKDVVGDVANADLFETEITTAEALLESVLQSTREVASILKSPESIHNKKCNGFKEVKSNHTDTMDAKVKGLSLPAEKTWSQFHPSVTPAQPKIASDNMVTLNLDPVPMGIPGGNFRWKKASYYSKVTNNHIANTKTLPGHGKGSAVKKFQEWHARHIETLAFSNAMNAATSKLKAYAATTEGGIQNSQHVPKLPLTPKNSAANSITTASKPALPKTGSENILSGQKRKYCTISNNYFQYLNRPKRARHDSLQVVFKAFVLLDEDRPAEHSDASFPKGFILWPSGKIPLPGYKTKRSFSRIENLIPLKKKRTTSKYRVPKPKPNPPMLQHFPFNTLQKPSWPPVRKPLPERRFFPLEKLKWDPASRRYTIHANAKASQPKKGQWFTFPSVSTKGAGKPGSFSYNDAIRKKFGVSGAPLSSFRPNLQFQTHQKTLYSPVKIQQNMKEINVVFKCVTAPQPECFGTFDEYISMCVLYQVRKIMAARAMRCGYVEGRFDNKPKTEAAAQNTEFSIEGVEPPPKKEVSNSIVLISTHTEMTFKMWSAALPKASELDKTAALATSKSECALGVLSRWLHVCKSEFVEELPQELDRNLPICHENEADKKLFKEASDAWLDNNSSDGELFLTPAKTLGVARHTGEPPYSVPSKVALRSFDTSSSSQPKHNLYNGVVHSKKQSVACNGHGKMQRSLSEIRSLSREKSDVRKKPRVLPKPSYCVRFRMCFCNFDCTCGTRTRFYESNFVKSTSKAAVKQEKGVKSIQTSIDNSPESINTTNDGFYDFNEKSDVPSVKLKSPSSPSPSKWDMRQRRSRSQSTVETSKFEWSNGFCDRGTFVKKIGETEIYHKWAVRRFSLPECDFDSIVEDVEREKPVQKMGNTEIVHRKAVKRMLTPEKCEERARSISVGTEMSNLSSLSNDDDMEIEFEIVEEILVDPDRIDTFTFANETDYISDEGAPEQMDEQPAQSSETDIKLETPVNRECLYTSSKQEWSRMARYELEAFAVSYRRRVNVKAFVEKENPVEIAALSICDRNRNNGDLESLQLRLGNASSCDESDKSGRHVSNPIGRDDSKHKHVNDSPDGQSLEVSVSSGGDICKVGTGSDPTIGDDGMGNTFRKQQNERELSPVLKSKFARTYANVLGNTQNVPPVLPNGILKPFEEFLGYKTTNLTDCRRSLEAHYGRQEPTDYFPGSEVNGYLDIEAVVTKERKNETVDGQEMPPVTCNDVERNTRSKTLQSLAVNGRSFQAPDFSKTTNKKASATAVDDNTDSQIVTRKRKFDAIQDVKPAKNAAAKLELSDGNGLKSAKKREIAPGNAETDLPVETRSSRRLRSRVNKKRGRYESDYVADLPKANKKPKRVLPTREYDNNAFWQFYRENERTLYSKNLILQNKYIKLLKSKGINSGFAGTPTALFSNVICASSSVPSDTSSTSVVPEDGLMPFMKRLTKPRKTIPELPKAADNHCAYCGRAFSEEDKKAFEDHLARHGMRYTMLTAPQLSKKKKTKKNGRKDSVLKRPKPSNNSNRTVIVVDPQESKTKDPRIPCVLAADSESTEQCDKLEPLPKPSHLSMGHRKQTARKSFSLASTLPKNMLIAALECKMRAQSTLKTDKTQPVSAKAMAAEQSFSPLKAARDSPSEVIQGSSNDILTPCTREFLPRPHSARKTLTGLPITYTHLNRNYIQALTSPTKSFR